eukprot:TRINITY_DN44560_c0_g1_i2.p1 TRINITY_DN44560_c0_g1~~TRINITY_DN44560_c0_g1_i2.p1  ORF type:complete len:344 (+),score=14.11 TRINITY_DN44560_c0_g1_i2:229-1260(+)
MQDPQSKVNQWYVSRRGERGRRGGGAASQFESNLYEPYKVQIQDRINDIHFMMWEFKIQPCTRQDTHEWTQCPHAHVGEKLARRDFLQTKYFPKACENMKNKKHCENGDNCFKAHNVFELWLHPYKYRTDYCTNKNNCTRALCFFAHNEGELRKNAAKEFEMELLRKHLGTGNVVLDPYTTNISVAPKTDAQVLASPNYKLATAQQLLFDSIPKNPVRPNEGLNTILQQALADLSDKELFSKIQSQGMIGTTADIISPQTSQSINDQLTYVSQFVPNTLPGFYDPYYNKAQGSYQPFSKYDPFERSVSLSLFESEQNPSNEYVYDNEALENKLGQDLVRCLSL